MLSVLIPIYNFNSYSLITNIRNQCNSQNIPFEIICIEDASTEFLEENKKVSSLENVSYSILSQNIGRSKIRNLLADSAKYYNLLFIDCDVEIPENFIKKYIPFLEAQFVTIGGVTYFNEKPNDPELVLRWKYGKKYESIAAELRKKKPYSSYKSCNFLITKTQFDKVRFSESITTYGHEDTLFGIDLKKQTIPILHIDNEVTHLGLDTAEVFLGKTRQAINNLIINNFYYKDVKLVAFANKLKILKLDKILLKKYLKKEIEIINNLLSDNPSLFKFSLFKLGYYLKQKS